jgi:CheY-like chemotaxis protein
MKTVLVVDDMPENLRLVRKILTMHGFRVLESLDAAQGLALAAAESPDVVLVDLRLGDASMTGFELASRLRKLPKGADTLLVALTGGAALQDDASFEEAGFDGFILKPFLADDFVAALKGYIAKKPGQGPK